VQKVENKKVLKVEQDSTQNKVTVTLPDGMVLSGTNTQVLSLLIKLGYSIHSLDTYQSRSTGDTLLIADMPSPHIRAAALKLLREHVTAMNSRSMTNSEVLSAFRTLMTFSNEFVMLVNELRKRGDD
jgi:hypothetical protein